MVNTNQMTKYQAYQNYSKSRIELVDAIPSEWQAKALKYSASVTMGQSPDSDDYEHEENGLPFLQGNAEFNSRNPKARLWCQTANKRCRKDDILLSVRAPVGAINLADQVYGIGRGLCAIRGIAYHQTFLTYLLRASNENLNVLATGSTFTAVSVDDVKSIGLPLPSYTEQQEIAEFLDGKTALIDDVIDRKQKLITLLREKRQALITHAITKGLDPNAKLKPSGINWVGDIPKGWESKRLKYISNTRPSNVDKKSEDDTTVKLCNYVDVYKNEFIDESIEFMSATATLSQIDAFELKRGDVIITKDSETPDDIGVPASVKLNDVKHIVCGYHLAIMTCNDATLFGGYLFRVLQSSQYRSYFETRCNGVTRFGLGTYSILNVDILLPPYDEQQAIASFLDRETAKIDSIVTKVKNQVWKLREYKQALITSAVTGKIDVRGQ